MAYIDLSPKSKTPLITITPVLSASAPGRTMIGLQCHMLSNKVSIMLALLCTISDLVLVILCLTGEFHRAPACYTARQSPKAAKR
jgi:hypothetical protein